LHEKSDLPWNKLSKIIQISPEDHSEMAVCEWWLRFCSETEKCGSMGSLCVQLSHPVKHSTYQSMELSRYQISCQWN